MDLLNGNCFCISLICSVLLKMLDVCMLVNLLMTLKYTQFFSKKVVTSDGL